MTSRKLKIRFRRQVRNSKLQAKSLTTQAGEGFERNFVKRLGRLANVQRFVITWLLLLLLLIGGVIAQTRSLSNFYQTLTPTPGGVYDEGIVGDYTNASPVYATGSVDTSVSRLVFSSLFTYNQENQLVGDLASSWSVDSTGTVYTVYLKPNLKWQDGQPLTSADVLFTYNVIQSPDAQSPLSVNFQGVTIAAPKPSTVTFTLPNPLSAFPNSLTTGIIPKHLLANVPMDEMRSTNFNTLDPVGSGPFKFSAVEVNNPTTSTTEESIELTPSDNYYGGTPKLSEFVIRAFEDQTDLVNSFNRGELTAIAGLTSLPSNLKLTNVQTDTFPLTAAIMAFFKTSSGVLADVNVRQALVEAANQIAIMSSLGYPTIAVREPLLEGQLAWNPAYEQAGYNPTAAEQALTADGWIPGANGTRYKKGQPLSFTLSASNSGEYAADARLLQQQWQSVGVDVKLSLQDATDLQNTVSYHNYDALLYGISIGVDPDVFVYWDSSQADPRSPTRLNLSEWSNSTADDALEEGRTRSEPALRVIKYEPFLQAFQQDAPALGLYQPRFLYITNGKVFGLNEHTINSGTDRYENVQNWEIREIRVTK